MAVVTVGSSGLAAEIRDHYDKTMLSTAMPELTYGKYATKKRIPKGEGSRVRWRRFSLLSPALVPLTEGITPPGNNLTIEEVTVSVNQYGDFVKFSDLVTVLSIDPIMDDNAEILGQQAGNTMDIIARGVLNAGTNVRFAGGRTSRSQITLADKVTDDELKKIGRTLRKKNAKPIPGLNAFVAIVSPDTMLDLMSTEAYRLTGEYQDKNRIYDGTVIKLYGIYFMETTNAQVFVGQGSGGIDVHSMIVFGKDAFAEVDIESLGLQTIYKALGSGGTEDPLNQRSSQGWKATYACAILNNDYIVRFEHAVSP